MRACGELRAMPLKSARLRSMVVSETRTEETTVKRLALTILVASGCAQPTIPYLVQYPFITSQSMPGQPVTPSGSKILNLRNPLSYPITAEVTCAFYTGDPLTSGREVWRETVPPHGERRAMYPLEGYNLTADTCALKGWVQAE